MLNIVPVRMSLANQDAAALLAELEEAVALNELAGCGCGCGCGSVAAPALAQEEEDAPAQAQEEEAEPAQAQEEDTATATPIDKETYAQNFNNSPMSVGSPTGYGATAVPGTGSFATVNGNSVTTNGTISVSGPTGSFNVTPDSGYNVTATLNEDGSISVSVFPGAGS